MESAKRPGPRPNGQRLTRRRIPLSCVACRIRKLKCNREKPCQNCIVRGEANAASCTYAEKVEKKSNGHSNPRSDAENMRQRLNRLESSILSMISSGDEDKEKRASQLGSPNPSNVSSEDRLSDAPDQAGGQLISLDTRSTHWDAILNELGAMKDAWSEENDKIEYSSGFEQATPVKAHRPSLLSGLSPPPDRSTILSSLPNKEAADKLVLRFFESYNPLVPARYLIHRPTFLKQYNRHWDDPTNSSIMWIGLLFSVLCLAMQSYTRTNETPPEYVGTAPAISELYRVRTAQCILIADITKPCEFMIEALTLHSFAEYVEERDGDMGTWLISGTMMRLALQQGYHRDPSKHPGLTIFQGEMRRRVWTALSQHELLFSVQIGLPKAIKFAESDTQPIRNIHEHELYEDMTELPPSRPLEEVTDIVYQVTKARIMRAYGHVIEFLHVLEPQPYEEVLKIDLLLMEARKAIPSHLQLGTLEEMRNDPPSKILERFILVLFWHKAICVLHRKFWDSVPPGTGSIAGDFHYSRKSCLVSSLALLELQDIMHQAAQPGGSLMTMRWWDFSLTNHDFLLAAMIICLDLMSEQAIDPRTRLPICAIHESEKLNAILRSRAIWAEVVDKCRDAKRAVSVLTSVINKLSVKMEEKRKMARMGPPLSASATNTDVDSLRYSPYFTDQFGLGMPSMAEQPVFNDTLMHDNLLDSAGLNVPADFNWDVFDQLMYTQTQTQTLGNDLPEEPQCY